MPTCCIPECNHSGKYSVCNFIRFPANEGEKQHWINQIGRLSREPSYNTRICVCHFAEGLRENGPTIFPWINSKRVACETPERFHRTKKPAKISQPQEVYSPGGSAGSKLSPSTRAIPISVTSDNATVSDQSRHYQPLPATTNAENYFLKKEIFDMAQKFEALSPNFYFAQIMNNDKYIIMYTGLPILDCTEVYIQISKHLNKQRLTYSHYKHRNTFKGLIGVAPNGVITYISNMYPGSTSDKKLVADCGILKQFEEGDLILADKVTSQFTPEQILRTKSIAKARIHVERAIARIKEYRILNLVPYYLQEYVDDIWQVCAVLTNFQNPLIKEVERLFTTEEC